MAHAVLFAQASLCHILATLSHCANLAIVVCDGGQASWQSSVHNINSCKLAYWQRFSIDCCCSCPLKHIKRCLLVNHML